MPRTSEMLRWVEALPVGSFFRQEEVPGPNRSAVASFLCLEHARPDASKRVVRVAPRLYWKVAEAHIIEGRLHLPSVEEVGDAFAGPHAAAVGWFGAHRVGWSSQLSVRFVYAVPGEPRSRNPIERVSLVGRRTPRRRHLNTIEATYLEALVTFDRWADEFLDFDDRWQAALDCAASRLRRRITAGLPVPAPEALQYAAATERVKHPHLFRRRVSECAQMVSDVWAERQAR